MNSAFFFSKTAYKVLIRRDIPNVRENAEAIDGKTFYFVHGWHIEEEDSSIYAGEIAMLPVDDNYPDDAPPWLSSGDLEKV